MDIAGDFDGAIDGDDVGLIDEDVFDEVAEFPDGGLGDGFALLDLLEPLIDVCHD